MCSSSTVVSVRVIVRFVQPVVLLANAKGSNEKWHVTIEA